MSKPKITVAVTGLNAIDSPGPGVPVIRALKESTAFEVRIIGLSYEPLEPGIYMRDLVDKTYQITYPSEGQQLLLQRLEYIHAKENLQVIIPNFDAELFSFIKLSDTLQQMGIATFLPTLEQYESRHKSNLYEYGKQHNIKVPLSKAIANPNDITKLTQEFSFPMVVKGKFYEAYMAYTLEQVHTYYHKLSAKWGLPVIIQQFVQGNELNVTVLGDGRGNTIGAVPMRKQFITDKGKAWAGVTIADDALLTMTQQLIRATQWRGAMELELIKTTQGEIYLLEINPRFPAWVYLANGAGQNHPEALVKMALGEQVPAFEHYEVGKLFIRYAYDMICDMADFQQISTMGEL